MSWERSASVGFYFLPLQKLSFIDQGKEFFTELPSKIKITISTECFFRLDFSEYDQLKAVNVPNDDLTRPENSRLLSEYFEKLRNRHGQYTMISNCFLGCLYSAQKTIQNYHTAIRVNLNPMNKFGTPSDFNSRNVDYHAVTKECLEHGPTSEMKIETLEHAFLNFNKICSSNNFNAFIELNTLYQAFFYYRSHDFSNGLLLGWLTMEKMLNHLYRDCLQKVALADGTKRRNKLSDHRSFSAAIKSEILYEKGFLTQEEYTRLEIMRKLRNDWAHSLKTVSQSEAYASLETTTLLFNKIYETDLNLDQPLNFVH